MGVHPRRYRDIDDPIVNLATHPTDVVTIKVLAAHQRCDVRTIVRMIESGALDGYKVGREWRVYVASACECFHVKRIVGHGATPRSQETPKPSARPSLPTASIAR